MRRLSRHCPLVDLPGHTEARRCALAAPVCAPAREDGARRPPPRSPKQAARSAETRARPAHSFPCVPRLPQDAVAGLSFQDRAGRSAPSKRARLPPCPRPRNAPRLGCSVEWLRRHDSVFAAKTRSARCARAAAGRNPRAETGCRWQRPLSRLWARRADQTARRNKPPRAPACPAAHRGRRAPAWLPDAAVLRPEPRDKPGSHPRRGSSRGSAWRVPDAC